MASPYGGKTPFLGRLMKNSTLRETVRRAALMLMLGALTTPALAQTDLGRWITRAPLPSARQEMPHAVIDGRIYVVGGIDGDRAATNVMEVYDPALDLWSPAKALPVAMHHLGVAAAQGKLYVLGGYLGNSFNPNNRVFEYDPATDGWTEKTPMPTARGAHVAVTVDDKIYAIGGAAFGTALGTNQTYDPATDTWATRRAMPSPREHLAATAWDGRIYVIGGRVPSNFGLVNVRTLEVYDPATDAWEELQGMPTARGGLAAAALHDKIYVFGGEFPDVFSQNEEYDPATDSWRPMEPMPVPRHGIGAVAVADTIFIIGGGPVAGFGVTSTNAGFVPPKPTPTAVADEAPLPGAVVVYPNHPNPFASRTTIRFALSRPAAVTLTIYDLLGRAVTTLIRDQLPAGEHEASWHAADHPNGVYLYRLTADGFATTKSLVVLR